MAVSEMAGKKATRRLGGMAEALNIAPDLGFKMPQEDRIVSHLTHVADMEKKCESLASMTSNLRSVIQNKDRIIARLQQPYSQDCIPVEAEYQNEDRTLWKIGTLSPGLITFYKLTHPLDKSWYVLGLGYNPSVDKSEIKAAAVIHYNGNMKPWLEIAMAKYRSY